jgi:hypothetical protein
VKADKVRYSVTGSRREAYCSRERIKTQNISLFISEHKFSNSVFCLFFLSLKNKIFWPRNLIQFLFETLHKRGS